MEVRRLVRGVLLIEVEAVAVVASFQPMTAAAWVAALAPVTAPVVADSRRTR